ncbi:hypothetical protein E2C01_039358 [Portunus trituberculatus]|uniref:Uncharacterized protein n=1 Tax=Portunus trituberculatus TaxID=210409 RepID=A0A5B7FGM5_PORTR|nr:hypothetical protein [Portunus trituberculatus]
MYLETTRNLNKETRVVAYYLCRCSARIMQRVMRLGCKESQQLFFDSSCVLLSLLRLLRAEHVSSDILLFPAVLRKLESWAERFHW